MKRMTTEELREIAEEKGFPIELESINPEMVIDIKAHLIAGSRIAYTTENGQLDTMSVRELSDYKSHKPEPKIETLYECLSRVGHVEWFFEDGSYPKFSSKSKSLQADLDSLTRKTGRTLKLNMDTWEIVTEE